jgi:O-succinylbenzoate synthase
MDISTIKLPGSFESIDLILVKLPFVKPFSTSSFTWLCKEALLLKINSAGVTGWGECVADPDPFYSPETTISARYIIKDFLLPLLTPGMTIAEMEDKFKHVRGNRMAKATVENAILDLIAKQREVPLYSLLGNKKKKIMSGISIGIQNSIPDLLGTIAESTERKYHRVKMKIKKGTDYEWVKAVRNRFPDIQLMADANGDYTLDDIELLKRLDEFNLTMIEQPLAYDDIYLHSKLQREITTPICLDESIHSPEDAATAIELKSCRILNIKQGRVGGLLEAMRMAKYALDSGMGAWSGGMDETGIGRAFNIHLQTADGFIIPGDTSETSRYYKEDIADPPITLDNEGFIEIPEGNGIGVKVPDRLVKKYTISEERL